MVWDIVVNVLLVVLFIVVTAAFIWLLLPEIKRSTRNAGTSMKEKKWRCRSCKNCKMLFDDGKVVCDKMDFKTPQDIPDICKKIELENVFDEFEDDIDSLRSEDRLRCESVYRQFLLWFPLVVVLRAGR